MQRDCIAFPEDNIIDAMLYFIVDVWKAVCVWSLLNFVQVICSGNPPILGWLCHGLFLAGALRQGTNRNVDLLLNYYSYLITPHHV